MQRTLRQPQTTREPPVMSLPSAEQTVKRNERGSAFSEDSRMDHGRCVFTANGEIQAQQVRAFLDAAGISSEVRGESLRHTHGLTLDGLGMVEILVSDVDAARARALLASADDGEFRLDDDADVGFS